MFHRPPEQDPEAIERGLERIAEQQAGRIPTALPPGYRPPTPETLPYTQPLEQRLPADWNKLTGMEKWMYQKGLPWAQEAGVLDLLEQFNESLPGRLLMGLDWLAERLERAVGLGTQAVMAAGDKEHWEEFTHNLKAAWQAGSMAADFANWPGIAVWPDGRVGLYMPQDLPGMAGVIEARQRIAAGESLDEVRASMYEDLGALALRAGINDAVFHIAADPLNVLPFLRARFPQSWLAPVSKIHLERASALKRVGSYSDAAIAGARAELATAEAAGDIAKAAELTARVAEMEGKAFSPWQKFVIRITGGLPLSPEDAVKFAQDYKVSNIQALKALFVGDLETASKAGILPWNIFKLTPQAKGAEVMDELWNHLGNILARAESPQEVQNILTRAMTATWGDDLMASTEIGRIVQGWIKGATAQLDDVMGLWAANETEARRLCDVAALIGEDPRVMMSALRDGDTAGVWAKIQDALETPLEGRLGLLQEAIRSDVERGFLVEDKLGEWAKIFQDAPFNLDTLKTYAMTALMDHATQMGISKFGLDGVGFWMKAANDLKAVESMAFLRLNPGYAVRNWWNNEITLLARGVYGQQSVEDIAKFWSDTVGVIPGRLFSGMGPAEVQAKSAAELGERVRGFTESLAALNKAARGGPTKLQQTINKIMSHLPFDAGNWASRAEAVHSGRAWTTAMKRYWADAWPRRVIDPDVFMPGLRQRLGDEVADALVQTIKSVDPNEGALEAATISRNLNGSINAIIERTAADLGIDPQHIREAIPQEILDAIARALPEAKTQADVNAVFRIAHEQAIRNIDDNWAASVEIWADEARELMKVDGPGGFLRTQGQLAVAEYGMNEFHLRRQVDEVPRIQAIADPVQRGNRWTAHLAEADRQWTRYFEFYDTRWKNTIRGARDQGLNKIADLVEDAVRTRRTQIVDFNNVRTQQRKWFFDRSWADTMSSEEAFQRMQGKIDTAYTRLIEQETVFHEAVDAAVGSGMPPEFADLYGVARQEIRNLRNSYMIDLREAYRRAEGMDLPQRQLYFREEVTPMRLEYNRKIARAEQRSIRAMAGHADDVGYYDALLRQEMATPITKRVNLEAGPDPRTQYIYKIGDSELTFSIGEEGPPILRAVEVEEAVRRQGIGTRLLDEALRDFKAMGYDEVILTERLTPAGQGFTDAAMESGRLIKTSEENLFTIGDIPGRVAEPINQRAGQWLAENVVGLKPEMQEPIGRFTRNEIAAEQMVEDIAKQLPEEYRQAFLEAMGAAPRTGATQAYLPDARLLFPQSQPTALGMHEEWGLEGAPMLRAMEEAAVEEAGRRPLKFGNLPEDVQADARKYIDHMKDLLREERGVGIHMAGVQRDAALLNYTRKTRFDTYTLATHPYLFWTTHSIYNWALWTLERPWVVSTYLRIKKLFETVKSRPGLPARMKNYSAFPIKMPFWEDWMGDMYWNPLKIGLPFESWLEPLEQYNAQIASNEQRVQRVLEAMLEDGEITQEEFNFAIANQSGPHWAMAMQQVSNGQDGMLDFFNMLASPHAPITWALNAARGRSFQEGPFLPITRTIKGLSGLLGIDTGFLAHPEGTLRKFLGLPLFDDWDDYRIDRMISNMVAEGSIPLEVGMRAMIDRSGDAFEEARRRAAIEYGIGAVGSIIGIPLKIYPPGEERARLMVEALGDAFQQEREGDEDAVAQFFEQYPEASARLALFDSPEERMHQFLVDQVYDTYFDMPTLHKQQVREALGDAFVDNMLAEETRNSAAVDIETLGMWLRMMGGEPPGTLSGSALPIALAPREVAEQVQVYYDFLDQFFPDDLYEQQRRYFMMEQGAARDNYKANHPILETYWGWRREFLYNNPDIAAYIEEDPNKRPQYESEEALMEVLGQQPRYSWIQWQMLLGVHLASLVADTTRGHELPDVGKEQIEEVAARLGITSAELLDLVRSSIQQ